MVEEILNAPASTILDPTAPMSFKLIVFESITKADVPREVSRVYGDDIDV